MSAVAHFSMTTCPHCLKELSTEQGLAAHMSHRRPCRLAEEAARGHRQMDAAGREPLLMGGVINNRAEDNSIDHSAQRFGNMDIDFEDLPYRRAPGGDDANPSGSATGPGIGMGNRHRVTVEDEPEADVEHGGLPRKAWVEDFPVSAGAGLSYGVAPTLFERLHTEQQAQGVQACNPFEDLGEWDLARWLMTSGLTQSSIDSYLKLNIVSICRSATSSMRDD